MPIQTSSHEQLVTTLASERPAVERTRERTVAVGRNLGLDLLRVVAVVLVLFRHMTPEPPKDMPALIRRPLEAFIFGAWSGVDLFFVLSGFLVSGLLFREARKYGSVSFKRFFVRRGWRIYPPFLALVVGYGCLEQLMTHSVTWSRLWPELFFVQNYVPGLWNHTWSLAVEEHFYLLIGVSVALLANHRRIHASPALLIGVMAICLVMRFSLFSYAGGALIAQSQYRVDALAFGALLAWIATFRADLLRWVPRYRGRLLLAGVALVIPAFVPALSGWHVLTWGLTSIYLGFGLIVLAAGIEPSFSFPGLSFVALLGEQSYSVYLWHMAVKRAVSLPRHKGFIEWPFFVELLVFVVLSFGFGILMARLIEIPCLRLRDRWLPARGGDVVPRS